MHGVMSGPRQAARDKDVNAKVLLLLLVAMTGVAPIDRRLIDATMLSEAERDWLNDYHARVNREVSASLDETDRLWLDAATAPLP